MFKWNVEDMALSAEYRRGKSDVFFEFFAERSTSIEEKIAFIDEMNEGKMSYFLSLAKKFEEDRPTLPKQHANVVKSVSLKAWIKKNDTKRMLDNTYNYGYGRICGVGRNLQGGMYEAGFDEKFIKEVFRAQLLECVRMEKAWFEEHDEYTILRKKVQDLEYRYSTTFGTRLSMSSDEMCVVDSTGNSRPITLDELKILESKYEKLCAFISELSSEDVIVY